MAEASAQAALLCKKSMLAPPRRYKATTDNAQSAAAVAVADANGADLETRWHTVGQRVSLPVTSEPLVGARDPAVVRSESLPAGLTECATYAAGSLAPGHRVIVGGTRKGTLRYSGAVHFANEVWCGVELDAGDGKNDGLVRDVRYFTCAANHGIFVPLSKVTPDPDGTDADTAANATFTLALSQSMSERHDTTYDCGMLNPARIGANGGPQPQHGRISLAATQRPLDVTFNASSMGDSSDDERILLVTTQSLQDVTFNTSTHVASLDGPFVNGASGTYQTNLTTTIESLQECAVANCTALVSSHDVLPDVLPEVSQMETPPFCSRMHGEAFSGDDTFNKPMDLYLTPAPDSVRSKGNSGSWPMETWDDDLAHLIQLESLALARHLEGFSYDEVPPELHSVPALVTSLPLGAEGPTLTVPLPVGCPELVIDLPSIEKHSVNIGAEACESGTCFTGGDISIVASASASYCASVIGDLANLGDLPALHASGHGEVIQLHAPPSMDDSNGAAQSIMTDETSAAVPVVDACADPCGQTGLESLPCVSEHEAAEKAALPAGLEAVGLDIADERPLRDGPPALPVSGSCCSSIESLADLVVNAPQPTGCSTPQCCGGDWSLHQASTPAAAVGVAYTQSSASLSDLDSGLNPVCLAARDQAPEKRPTARKQAPTSKLAEYLAHGNAGCTGGQEKASVKRNPPRSRWADISKQLEESRTAASVQRAKAETGTAMTATALTVRRTSSTSQPAWAAAAENMANDVMPHAPGSDKASSEDCANKEIAARVLPQPRRTHEARKSALPSAAPGLRGVTTGTHAPVVFKPSSRLSGMHPPLSATTTSGRDVAAAPAVFGCLEHAGSVASISSDISQASSSRPSSESSSSRRQAASGMGAGESVTAGVSVPVHLRRQSSLLPLQGGDHGVRRMLPKSQSERRLRSPVSSSAAAVAASASSAHSQGGTARRQLPTFKKPAPVISSAISATASSHQPPSKTACNGTSSNNGLVAGLHTQQPASSSSSSNASVSSRAQNPPDVVPFAVTGHDVLSSTNSVSEESATATDRVDGPHAERKLAESAEAELAAAAERVRQLKADGERRELENAQLRCEVVRLATAANALAILLKYTTEQLDAFSAPHLTMQNRRLEAQLKAVNDKKDSLEVDISSLEEAMRRNATESTERCAQLTAEHSLLLAELRAQMQDAKTSYSEEISRVSEDATRVQADLQDRVESLKKECDDLRCQYRRVEEALTKDADVKVQLALSPYKYLPKEVESLMTVVDLKNADIQKLRKENNEASKQLDELAAARERVSLLEQRVEALQASLEARALSERELHDKHEALARRCEHESREKLRLSMNCEELQYRLQDAAASPDMTCSLIVGPIGTSTQQRHSMHSSPRTSLEWNGASMTASMYEPGTSVSLVDSTNVKMRRSLSSNCGGGSEGQHRRTNRRKLSFERDLSPALPPPISPAMMTEHREQVDEDDVSCAPAVTDDTTASHRTMAAHNEGASDDSMPSCGESAADATKTGGDNAAADATFTAAAGADASMSYPGKLERVMRTASVDGEHKGAGNSLTEKAPSQQVLVCSPSSTETDV